MKPLVGRGVLRPSVSNASGVSPCHCQPLAYTLGFKFASAGNTSSLASNNFTMLSGLILQWACYCTISTKITIRVFEFAARICFIFNTVRVSWFARGGRRSLRIDNIGCVQIWKRLSIVWCCWSKVKLNWSARVVKVVTFFRIIEINMGRLILNKTNSDQLYKMSEDAYIIYASNKPTKSIIRIL